MDPVEPEAAVRSVRRRRNVPPSPEAPPASNARTWLIYGTLLTAIAGLMLDGYLIDRPSKPPLPSLSQATQVRSAIAESAESLQVVVGWDLTLADSSGVPNSVRVRVIPEQADTLVLTQPANQLADTAYLPVPPVGHGLQGVSCVAAQHRAQPLEEVCVPWEYTRPQTGPPS